MYLLYFLSCALAITVLTSMITGIMAFNRRDENLGGVSGFFLFASIVLMIITGFHLHEYDKKLEKEREEIRRLSR